MKRSRFSSVVRVILVGAGVLLPAANLLAKARSPGPPWPGSPTTVHLSFDQPRLMPTNQVPDPSIWAESWSGWCLDRTGPAPLTPWVMPMVATNGRPIIDGARGAVRLWYRPAWNGASTGLGAGPGSPATLLAMVTTNGNTSAPWWELVITSDGNNVQLICPESGTPAVCLSAPVAFQAGTWIMFTVCYTETNSAIFVNDQLAVSGAGLPSLPDLLAPFTSLTIGSAFDGQSPAAGQIDELAAFSGRNHFRQIPGYEFGLNPAWDIERYYGYLAPIAALGPITPEEEAARLERVAAMRAARLSSRQGTGYGMEAEFGPLNLLQASSYAPGTLWLEITGADSNANLVVHETSSEYVYSLLSVSNLTNTSWQTEMIVRGAEGQNWTDLSAPVGDRTNQLFFVDKAGLDDQVEKLMSTLNPGVRGGDLESFLKALQGQEVGNAYYKVDPRYLLVGRMGLESRPGVPGVSVADLDNPNSNFQAILSQLDKDRQYIAFLVRDDSFTVFRKARQMADTAGFDTGWELLGIDEPIKFGEGGTAIGTQ